MLKPTEAFQEKLYQEMLGRILQTDLSVPYSLRGYLYFTRTAEGKQYPFHCRRRDGEGSAEELLLDLNLFAEGHSFLGLGCLEVSEDNGLLAYSTDTTGFRQFTLEMKDLRTGTIFPERVERVTSVAWASDNRTLFYTVEDETTKRSHRLYRHVLGAFCLASCSSMLLTVWASVSSSADPPRAGTRRARSPSAMADAVRLISRTSERSARRIIQPMRAPSTSTVPTAAAIPYQKRSTSDWKRALSRPKRRRYPPGNRTYEATTRRDEPPRSMISPDVPGESGTSAGHASKFPATRALDESARRRISSRGKIRTRASIAAASPVGPSRSNVSTIVRTSSASMYVLNVE